MRRGIGAILTTGVALVGAAIVVANPVAAPPSDVRVPPVKLSADSTTSGAALDRAFLEAIAKDAAPSSPAADLLKRSVAGVVTNVTLLSGRAVEEFKIRQANDKPAHVPPPPPSVPPKVVADLLSGKPANVVVANPPAAILDDPVLQHAVTSVADYVGYVSVKAVEATEATGRIAASSPTRIADTLAKLAHGDVDTAITTALRRAVAPLGPPSVAVKAIQTEVRKRLTELADRLRRAVPQPPRPRISRHAPADRTVSVRSTLGHRRGPAITVKPTATADPSEQADALLKKPTTVNGATDLSDGNKAVPRTKAPQAQLRQRVDTSFKQTRTSLDRLADTLRKVLPPPPKVPKQPRPHRPQQP